jgi:hypothetical protein
LVFEPKPAITPPRGNAMEDALKTMLPMLAFMLIPIWIPMIAVAASTVAEKIGRTA